MLLSDWVFSNAEIYSFATKQTVPVKSMCYWNKTSIKTMQGLKGNRPLKLLAEHGL